MDRHRVVADPDLDFHFDANPDLDPDWHQNDPDPHAGSDQVLHMLENRGKYTFFTCNACLRFSFLSGTGVYDFKYFGQHIKFSGKSKKYIWN